MTDLTHQVTERHDKTEQPGESKRGVTQLGGRPGSDRERDDNAEDEMGAQSRMNAVSQNWSKGSGPAKFSAKDQRRSDALDRDIAEGVAALEESERAYKEFKANTVAPHLSLEDVIKIQQDLKSAEALGANGMVASLNAAGVDNARANMAQHSGQGQQQQQQQQQVTEPAIAPPAIDRDAVARATAAQVAQNLDGRAQEGRGRDGKGQEDKGLGSKGLESKGMESKGLESKGLESKGMDGKGADGKDGRGNEGRSDGRSMDERGVSDRGQDPRAQEAANKAKAEGKGQDKGGDRSCPFGQARETAVNLASKGVTKGEKVKGGEAPKAGQERNAMHQQAKAQAQQQSGGRGGGGGRGGK